MPDLILGIHLGFLREIAFGHLPQDAQKALDGARDAPSDEIAQDGHRGKGKKTCGPEHPYRTLDLGFRADQGFIHPRLTTLAEVVEGQIPVIEPGQGLPGEHLHGLNILPALGKFRHLKVALPGRAHRIHHNLEDFLGLFRMGQGAQLVQVRLVGLTVALDGGQVALVAGRRDGTHIGHDLQGLGMDVLGQHDLVGLAPDGRHGFPERLEAEEHDPQREGKHHTNHAEGQSNALADAQVAQQHSPPKGAQGWTDRNHAAAARLQPGRS